ncbi:MAG TPA: protease pro-enzyme activation domain-containing protein [Candidatus Aquilonibacter sp.]|nr:protease pro-enzyme activation domain-containing protein [Candidatus Aquilonibacter sp.]
MKQRFAVPSSLAVLAVVACLCCPTFALNAPPLLTHHVRQVTLNGHAPLVGHLPETQSMRLVFVLPLRNQPDLHSLLSAVSDPNSQSYRHFLTVDEFTARYGPTQQDYDAVTHFAEAHGLTVVGTSRNRMNLDVTGSVANIEKALNITLGLYHDPTENRDFYAPDREPAPALSVQLWHISGLDNYSIPHPMLLRKSQIGQGVHSNATIGSCPGASFCGSDMRAAYYGGTALTGTGQYVGLLEYYGTDLKDLTTYYTNAHQTNNVPITLLSTDGTSVNCVARQGCDDTEQTLDMTQALGMAPGLTGLTMYIGSTDTALLNAMSTGTPLIYNLSSSWTWTPADPSTDDPYYEEMQLQGQTLFQASGDSGKWSKSQEYSWPSDNQYVISTGGTDLDTQSAGGPWASETAWSDSGGGISPNGVAIPTWQVQTAAGCSDCSQTLRNGPDVSANANFSFYVCADQTTCTENDYGGTSFAAPMWAGYVALANQQAVSNGEPTVGFINPTIYTIGLGTSYDTDFHDITSGSNGWPATVGYDLVTGWGSPNGDNLINALAPAANPSFTISASPNRIKIAQGSSATSTITTAVSGGFDSAITLSASLKTATFNPSTIPAPGSGTSTMTITVPKGTATGIYKIQVKGSGDGKSESALVEIDVVK